MHLRQKQQKVHYKIVYVNEPNHLEMLITLLKFMQLFIGYEI